MVPAHSAADVLIRAEEDAYLDELKQKVLNCFIGAATASEARLEYKWADIRYAIMDNNPILAQVFSQNLQSLGREVIMPDPGKLSGSTDMGNVSQLTPSIQAVVGITSQGVSFHTSEFAVAAASEAGINGLIDGAKALAMTVVDLVSNSEVVMKIKGEFQGSRES